MNATLDWTEQKIRAIAEVVIKHFDQNNLEMFQQYKIKFPITILKLTNLGQSHFKCKISFLLKKLCRCQLSFFFSCGVEILCVSQ